MDTGFQLVTVVPRGASVGLHVGGELEDFPPRAQSISTAPTSTSCVPTFGAVRLSNSVWRFRVFTFQASWSDAWLY